MIKRKQAHNLLRSIGDLERALAFKLCTGFLRISEIEIPKFKNLKQFAQWKLRSKIWKKKRKILTLLKALLKNYTGNKEDQH